MEVDEIVKAKPNILLLYTDQQRYDTIHSLGNSNILNLISIA